VSSEQQSSQLIEMDALLRQMAEQEASDLFVTVGMPPSLKVNGSVVPLADKPLNIQQVEALVYGIMTEQQVDDFKEALEANFALHDSRLGRFRINVFQQQNEVGMVIRRIKMQIPTFEELQLPAQLRELSMGKRGLVLLVGATGSGKSSSLAAMVGHRNLNSHGHIVSVEDPVEYVHVHRGCVVTQREVGIDTHSYEAALQNTLRQAPDVILIGEIRSRETMEYAIAFAETGHLVLSTLHATNAPQALDRIINFFPAERRSQLLMDMSLHMNAVVAQRLLPSARGQQRRVAVEMMLNTPLVADLILRGETHLLRDVMKKSSQQGMKTFDQALFELYKEGEISLDDAIMHADSPNEVRLMIKLGGQHDPADLASAMQGITVEGAEEEEGDKVVLHHAQRARPHKKR
jgi:twitching motility protein PilU